MNLGCNLDSSELCDLGQVTSSTVKYFLLLLPTKIIGQIQQASFRIKILQHQFKNGMIIRNFISVKALHLVVNTDFKTGYIVKSIYNPKQQVLSSESANKKMS